MTNRVKLVPLMVENMDLKMLRETLCLVQSKLDNNPSYDYIQKLIDEIDYHRPLGPDGKHSNLHTATCGCEDK